jgi:uncharacterized protein YhaN
MKLHELNLIAFGPFSDCCIDLSQGEQALQMIYGPNEAGKSSSLLAINYLLYGFPAQTPVDFKHPYKHLRVGGRLSHSDGRELQIVRRKANQKSLRCASDLEPFEDDVLLPFLGDVDQGLFTTMFGINHERLRRGGQEIAQGSGRIGEMLFAAGAGLVDLQQLQLDLHADSDQLLKGTGRSGTIHVGIQEYLHKRKAVDEALVSVDAWSRVAEELRMSRQLKVDLDQRQALAQRELQKLQRVKLAIPIIDRLRIRRESLQQLGQVPSLPEDFAQTANQLLMDLRAHELRYQAANSELEKINEQLRSLSLPKELIQAADGIEALRDRVGTIRAAMADRAMVDSKRDSFEREAKQILRELGRSADLSIIESLRLPRDKVVKIQSLGNQLERLGERRLVARKQCEKLQSDVVALQERLKCIPEGADLSRLRASLQWAQQQGDLEAELSSFVSESERLQVLLSSSLRQLPLFAGELSELTVLVVPSAATIERYERELAAADHQLQSLTQSLKEETEALDKLRARLSELEAVGIIPTLSELTRRRQLRDQGWQLVLQEWKAGPAQPKLVAEFVRHFSAADELSLAFQQAMHDADELADALRQDADRVATKAKLELDLEQLQMRHARRQSDMQQAQQERQTLHQRWCQSWQAWGFSPLSPAEMQDWLRQHTAIRLLMQQLSELDLRRESHQLKISETREHLLRDMEQKTSIADPIPHSLKELLHLLQEQVDAEQHNFNLRGQLTEQLFRERAELGNCQAECKLIDAAVAEVQAQWSGEMQHLGLEPTALPAQANSRLASLQSLFETYKEAERFHSRLLHIDQDVAQFAAEVSKLVERLAPELSEVAFETAFQQLYAKLEAARLAASQQADLCQRQQLLTTQKSKLKIDVQQTEIMLDEMMRQAQVDDRRHLVQAAEKSRLRLTLDRQVRELEDEIVDHCAGLSLTAFMTEVENAMGAEQTIDAQIATCEQKLQAIGEARDAVLGRIRSAEIEEEKFDGSSLAMEQQAECESIATRLETEVQSLSVMRVAAAVLNAAIERHRQKNQGPILGRASQIFQQITLGRFVGLQAEYNEKGEPILAGIRGDVELAEVMSTAQLAGSSAGGMHTLPLFDQDLAVATLPSAASSGERVTVDGMSDGTCDQLYLSLRIASLESWLKHHEPIPFIVDDILMNFDDARAVATLQVLADLAQQTQVIFFTHHQHLLELAQEHLSEQQLHITGILAASARLE